MLSAEFIFWNAPPKDVDDDYYYFDEEHTLGLYNGTTYANICAEQAKQKNV